MNAMARDLSQLVGPSGSGHQPACEIQVMHTSGGVQRVANWHPRNRRPSCVARGQLVCERNLTLATARRVAEGLGWSLAEMMRAAKL